MVVVLLHDSPINTAMLWTVGALVAALGPAAFVPILLDRRGQREQAAVIDGRERAILGLLIAVLPWLSLDATGSAPWSHLLLIVFVTVSAGQALINLQDPNSNRSNFVILTILSISYITAFIAADVPLLVALGVVWALAVSQGARAAHETQEELTELKQAGERAARHDDLTGLLNRSGMREQMVRVLDSEDDWSFVLLDLDGFKKINDTLGHGTGDDVLRLVGARMERSLPATARCGRMGGDEFAVLIQRASTDPIAVSTINALIGAIQEPMSIGEHTLQVGVSAGLAPINRGDEIADVLLHSDHAMYKAKRTPGQDLATFSDRIGAAISRRDLLERRLREALDNDEIVFHAQPIVRLDDLTPTGVELLARWPQADGSFISPAEFIPVAEETGMIIDLGRHALATASALLAQWHDGEEFGHLQVSINVSARHLDSGLVHDVIGTFDDRSLVRRLAMDFVESELITADARPEIELRRLASLGASLAVDDFGVGYSSLTTLRSLPMTNLKIDRFFVNEIDRSERAYLLLASIVAMSGALGLPTVAEGIESHEELAVLRELGVDHGQGYHVARPTSLDALEPELRRLDALAHQTLSTHQ